MAPRRCVGLVVAVVAHENAGESEAKMDGGKYGDLIEGQCSDTTLSLLVIIYKKGNPPNSFERGKAGGWAGALMRLPRWWCVACDEAVVV